MYWQLSRCLCELVDDLAEQVVHNPNATSKMHIELCHTLEHDSVVSGGRTGRLGGEEERRGDAREGGGGERGGKEEEEEADEHGSEGMLCALQQRRTVRRGGKGEE